MERVPVSLMSEARRSKQALRYTLFRQRAEALRASIDGDFSLTERQARVPGLLAFEEKVTRAQAELWSFRRRDGFTILWSSLIGEFILVRDGSPQPVSEALAFYSWFDVEALRDASPEMVIEAHRVKKVFAGRVAASGCSGSGASRRR